MNDWWKRTKPMGTEWHKIGEAQQGMTDLDTGDLVSMERAHQTATGRGFTEGQTEQAGKLAKGVKKTREDAKQAQQKVIDAIDKEKSGETSKSGKPSERKNPIPKTPKQALYEAREAVTKAAGDPKSNPDAVKAIWQHAKKSYIEMGVGNIDEIAQGVSNDLGLPKRTVMEVLAGSKGTRRLTDEMYLKMARARQAEAAARAWLINQQFPGWIQKARKIPRLLFSAKVFGHGTVGMVTHAGVLVFDPRVADTYWSNFGKQYGLVFKEGYHEAAMQDLMHRNNFVTARRAGLANDPFRFQDDYQNPAIAASVGKWSAAGNRGFDILKLLRQDLFDKAWDGLDAELKTPEMAGMLAKGINHATGITHNAKLGDFANPLSLAFFAPKLEMSRWAFGIGDPLRAIKTALNWKNEGPVARMEAVAELKQKTVIAATYMSLLAMNQAMLKAFGSDQEVNFTNPHKGDFLAFKILGQDVSVISPMLHMIGFLADLWRIARSDERGKLEKLEGRREEAGSRAFGYMQGKLSPFAQPISDVVWQSDFRKRPMPFSEDRVPKNLRREGYDAYTWPEYITQTLSPIPVAEATREVLDSKGMDDKKIVTFVKGLSAFLVTGGTGVRVSADKSVK